MAFRKYKEIGDVLQAFDLNYQTGSFIEDTQITVPENLVEDIDYTIKNLAYKTSEAAIGEMIIFPILKDVWRKFDNKLSLWSHKSISYGKELSGIPDYLIAKQSKHGKVVLGKPLLAVVEAKKDDFIGGWSQCLLEMYTIQKINKNLSIPIFGIVSNGDIWEFGRLLDKTFVQENKPLYLTQLDELYSSLHYILQECTNKLALLEE